MTSENSKELAEFNRRMIEAIDTDLRVMGLSLCNQSDLEKACDLLEQLYPNHAFPNTTRITAQLQKSLVSRAKRAFETVPHSGSVLEDYGQENYWEEYKLQRQRSYDGLHTDAYQEVMRVCCDSVAEELSQFENRVLNTVVFGPNEEQGDEPVTASDLMYEGLEELAGFEPLLNDPDDEDEDEDDEEEKVDENGDPLFTETADDERLFQEIRNFVTSLLSRTQDPRTICQIAISLNYLDRMPRRTTERCQLTITYQFNGETRYASLDGDEDRFALSRGGTIDSGVGADGSGENDFVRTYHGDSEGDMCEIRQWISQAQELLNLGATISSDSLELEELTWDDGESSMYWELLDDLDD